MAMGDWNIDDHMAALECVVHQVEWKKNTADGFLQRREKPIDRGEIGKSGMRVGSLQYLQLF